MMLPTEIARLRLISQRLSIGKLDSARSAATWMVALQAQDYAMSKWAFGVRVSAANEPGVEAALNSGEILRTHLLRPTWHIVAAEDVYWLLELNAARIRSAFHSRNRQLELSEAVFAESSQMIETALREAGALSREALILELNRHGIVTDNNRAAHLFMRAELDGILCSGPLVSGKPTYDLLERRVERGKSKTRAEALAELARRYFTSRGPATLEDFTWWSGLTVSEARQALEMIKAELVSETIENQIYWLTSSFPAAVSPESANAIFLPAFDEFIISYTDRSAALPPHLQARAISSNGIFWPTVVVDGQVMGLWKRTVKGQRVHIEIEFFQQPDREIMVKIERAAADYGYFLGKQAQINAV